jgi:hypothetical protein
LLLFTKGSSPGGVDVATFKDVGVTNHAAIHGLSLQSGLVYYATVRGKNHALESIRYKMELYNNNVLHYGLYTYNTNTFITLFA